MPHDSWSELNRYLLDERTTAAESVISGSLNPQSYAATCKKVSTIDEILAKMKELVGDPEAPGDDV